MKPLRIFHYRLPLRQGLLLKQGLLSVREGLLIEQQGRYGEVAPFPGLSRESLADCLAQLQSQTPPQQAHPALAWGYEMLARPLEPAAAPARLPVNALLAGERSADLLAAAQALYAEGYRHFKLKVGIQDQATDLARIRQLQTLGPDLRLRLDANRSWSLEAALAFADRLPAVGIEYLEEPLADPQAYPKLLSRVGFPLALDETLLDDPPAALLDLAAVYVLKPMLLGPARVDALIRRAGARPVVFSSVFESGLGLRYIALRAQGVPGAAAAGLDTWRAWVSDLWQPAFSLAAGEVNFSASVFTQAPLLRLKWVRQIA